MKILQELLQVAKNIEKLLRSINDTLADPKPPEAGVWLDDWDLMQKFNISRTTLYRLKQKNILKPYQLGGKVVYLEQEVVLALKNYQK